MVRMGRFAEPRNDPSLQRPVKVQAELEDSSLLETSGTLEGLKALAEVEVAATRKIGLLSWSQRV